jgi:hypothetical protein
MKDIQKIEKILDYSFRKSLTQVKYGHPSHFGEYVSYKEDLGLDHLDDTELKREFHKLIFHSFLRTYKILNEISLKESDIFFENIEKKYLKT